jgi:hypothetical protein
LQAATLSDVLFERGHLSTERWRPDPIHSVLKSYDVTLSSASASLYAEVEHELNDGWLLVEAYSVYRVTGDTGPVTVSDDPYGSVTFSLLVPGTDQGVSLGFCTGGDEAQDAVSVMRGTMASGKTMVLTRYWRTRDVFAGSYPVHVVTTEARFSDDASQAMSTDDFFAQTYSAEHHNWVENSVIDFLRDPAFFHVTWRPLLDGTGQEAISRIDLNAIDAYPTEATIDVTTSRVDGGAIVDTYQAATSWKRVDDTWLTRSAQWQCPEADVFGLQGFEEKFQLMTCPATTDPGYTLLGVVPVVFLQEASLVGDVLGPDMISTTSVDGRAGHRVQMGSHTVDITTADGTAFYVDVYEDGTSISSFYAERTEIGAAPPRHMPAQWTVKASNSDGISMELQRKLVTFGVGESMIFAPLSFTLTFNGQTALIDGMDQLFYVNTHHNWMDSLEAHVGGRVYTWEYRYLTQPPFEGTHTVRVTENGQDILPATTLTEVD